MKFSGKVGNVPNANEQMIEFWWRFESLDTGIVSRIRHY